ncbi:MAG: hypothetical protein JNJ59_16795 [Deltaproteobacteria bacterium]|nr:hypothetical protein [Deltaproteobacteria bacterium]
MTRALVLSTLAILCAFVLALALNIWITWDHVLPERPGAARFLAPGLKFTLGWLEAGLAEVPDRTPAALQRVLGVPVAPLTPEGADALAAAEHVSIPLGAERFDLYVDDLRDARQGVLHTRAHGPLLIGELRGMSPFNRDTVPLWIGLSLLIGAIASVVILRPLFVKLRRLEDTAKRLSAGDLDARAPLSGPTHMLALALNTMAERTGHVLKSHEALLQAVAHELRTPTARIRFGVELMVGVETRAERALRADALDRDLTELDALVSELLSFTRLGVESRSAPRTIVDAVEVVREVVDEVGARHAVTIDGTAAPVQVERAAMRRALRNLIMNAERHARERIVISVSVADRVVVTVDDDGPGVPAADRERIFAPFAMVEASRTRQGAGVGLGLAIVQRVAELHGGRAWCEAAPQGGARFVTTWPRALGLAPTGATSRRLDAPTRAAPS